MSDQYKKEIEEILEKAGESPVTPVEQRPTPRPGLGRLLRQYFRRSMGGGRWPISPGRVMLTAVSLLLMAVFLRAIVPGAVGPLGIIGIVLFLVGYGMFFVRGPKGPEKKWRGQLIEEPSNNVLSAWWGRIRSRLKK